MRSITTAAEWTLGAETSEGAPQANQGAAEALGIDLADREAVDLGVSASKTTSKHPRPQDLSQLQSAYVMHRQECRMCTPDQSCEMAKRLERDA